MASEGALKLPDLGAASDDQLALEGFFAPTGVVQGGVLTSVDPRPLAPQVAIVVYQGYLGLDSGIPQSVYSLDADADRPGPADRGGVGEPVRGGVADPGRRHDRRLHRLREFAALQYSHDPGQGWVLGAAIALLLSACSGCCCSAGSGCSPGSPPGPATAVPC